MCGIVGILGREPVAGQLVDALKRLEYRGYDSAGVATLEHGALTRRRAEGKLRNLETSAVVDKTFRAGERFPRVHTEVKNVQYLYEDGNEAHFMDAETYEQFAVPSADLADVPRPA